MARIEGADISIQDFLEENKDLSQSNLQQAYEKSSVLLTGVTSFIGSVVLEKLLRSCPEIDCVYVLIRSRDRKEPVERMEDLFKSPLFDRLKMEYPTTLNKVHVIQCDFYEDDLGISNDDYLLLTSKINCVIHAARLIGSTVKFKEAVLINLKALQNILKLCSEMKKLDAVSYVSNIFGHFNEAVVEEKLYPCSLTGDCLINMIHNLSDETLEAITPGITGDYPNVSLLTLAVAENILKEKGEGLPLCIVRPPFVLASCNEPIAGWIQTQRQESPTDILLNVFLGKLFNIHCDSTYLTEAVPVDMVANFIIAVSGSLLLRRKEWINQAVIIQSNCKRNSMVQNDFPDIQIYNLISSNKHKLSWAEFFKNSIKHEEEVPFLDTIWYSSLKMNKHWVVHWLLTWLQLGQVVLFDKIKGVFGINSELLETVKQLQNMSDTVLKFCKKQWRLKDDNVVNLWESMSIADRNHFDFNLKALDWTQFFYTQCRGLRVYLMNDPLSTVPDAQKNRKRMKTTYSLFTSVLLILLCYIIYKMLS